LAFTAYWNYPIAEKLPGLKIPVLARAETAALIPGAHLWAPAYEGDVLTATPAQLAAQGAPVIDFVKSLDC
ncbi:MAG: hypothetical protein JNK21_05865, partial [Rhodospirillaceae bacterium]|nr:hypothetical protein [Rhodospirillaceae bacterium]